MESEEEEEEEAEEGVVREDTIGCDDGGLGELSPLSNKEGPCLNLAKQPKDGNGENRTTQSHPSAVLQTRIFAFESTIRTRDPDDQPGRNQNHNRSNNNQRNNTAALEAEEHRLCYQRLLHNYSDRTECRLYDTDPSPLANALSKRLWPSSSEDFVVGLRVDALDHKNHWYPGSIVDVSPLGDGDGTVGGTAKKIKVHFDNFSYKWDLSRTGTPDPSSTSP